MRACGATISGSEITLVTLDVVECTKTLVPLEPRKIPLKAHGDQASIQAFLQNIQTYVRANNIDCLFIKQRAGGGEYAGGAVGFKIEALVQSLNIPVTLISPQKLSVYLKKHAVPDAKVFQYQADALGVACCGADLKK